MNGVYANVTESIVKLVKAVEDLAIPLSAIEASGKFEKAKGTIQKYWDVIQEKTQKVPNVLRFSDGDGNSWAAWPEPQPMDSFSKNLNPDIVCPCPATEAALSYLWTCSSIQKAFDRRHEFQLSDSAAYLLNNIKRICKPDYDPTDEDILRTRVTTMGIVNIEFAFQNWTVSRKN